jgi:hypothetical protein
MQGWGDFISGVSKAGFSNQWIADIVFAGY